MLIPAVVLANRVHLDQQELQVTMVSPERTQIQVTKESKERTVKFFLAPCHPRNHASSAHPDLPALSDNQDPRDPLDQKESPLIKLMTERRVNKACLDHKEFPGQLDHQDPKDQKVNQDELSKSMGPQDPLENVDPLDQSDQREAQEKMAVLAHKEKLDPLETKERSDPKEIQVSQVPQVYKENPDQKDHATNAHLHVPHQVIKKLQTMVSNLSLDHLIQSLLLLYIIYFYKNSNP